MGNMYFVNQDIAGCTFDLSRFIKLRLGRHKINSMWVIEGYETADDIRKENTIFLFESEDKAECEYVYTHMTNCILEHKSMVYRHELYEDYKKRNGLV